MILVITVNLIIFTDFVPEVEVQYNVGGWMYCGVMAVCIIYNLSFVVMALFWSMKLNFVKYYKLLKSKFNN